MSLWKKARARPRERRGCLPLPQLREYLSRAGKGSAEMSVYVDPAGSAPGRRGRVIFCCHMFADSVEELVKFARGIGLRRSWLQGGNQGRLPHFDLTAGKRAEAVAAGARRMRMGPELAALIRRLREEAK